MRNGIKRWFVVVVGLLAVTGILVGVKAGQIVTMVRAGESFAPPPESVTAAKVSAVEWESKREAVGSLVAVQGVTVASELPGQVREVAFESGAAVKRGDVLVRLDTSVEETQLAGARADASLAKINLARARKLRAAGSNAQADLDAAEARAQQTAAAVANLQAIIAKKTIRAPFDGRVAIREVERGQVVTAGTPIASLHSVSPIHADFWLPQQVLADMRPGQRVRLATDVFDGERWEGEITTINPQVDPATRNVRVRATFENRDGRLRPGMFANVEVLSPDKRRVLVVPASAVIFAPYGDSVFVIEEEKSASGPPRGVARQKFIRPGERRGDFVAVASGLTAGETVVSTGAFKLRNGAAVVVNDAVAPDAKVDPEPSDR
jgi:membrane fusion protein (multidrug efflux system)